MTDLTTLSDAELRRRIEQLPQTDIGHDDNEGQALISEAERVTLTYD